MQALTLPGGSFDLSKSSPRCAHVTSTLIIAVTLTACAADGSTLLTPTDAATQPAASGQTVWRAQQVGWVRLVEAEPGAGSLDHPVQLDPASVAAVLRGLTVEYPELERSNDVFTDDEIEVLVPALVRALATAGPDQDVAFATTANRRLTLFVNRPSVNTARVFFDDGKLNIILGHVNTGYTEQFDDAGYLRDFEPGTRRGPVSIGEDWIVDSRTGGWERRREDWMAAPVQRDSGPLPELVRNDPAGGAQDAATAGEPRPAADDTAPAATPAAAAQSAPPRRTEEDQYDALKRRLEVLKEMHAEGLITDEEYDSKRSELLDEL